MGVITSPFAQFFSLLLTLIIAGKKSCNVDGNSCVIGPKPFIGPELFNCNLYGFKGEGRPQGVIVLGERHDQDRLTLQCLESIVSQFPKGQKHNFFMEGQPAGLERPCPSDLKHTGRACSGWDNREALNRQIKLIKSHNKLIKSHKNEFYMPGEHARENIRELESIWKKKRDKNNKRKSKKMDFELETLQSFLSSKLLTKRVQASSGKKISEGMMQMIDWVLSQRQQGHSYRSIFKEGYNLHYKDENGIFKVPLKDLPKFYKLEKRRDKALLKKVKEAQARFQEDGIPRFFAAGVDHVESVKKEFPEGVGVLSKT